MQFVNGESIEHRKKPTNGNNHKQPYSSDAISTRTGADAQTNWGQLWGDTGTCQTTPKPISKHEKGGLSSGFGTQS